MFDDVLEIIKKAGIFMILAQTILHLCASVSYEKYLKMIVGLITAVMLILPIIHLFQDGGVQNFESYRKKYEAELLGGAPDFEKVKEEAWQQYWEENMRGE